MQIISRNSKDYPFLLKQIFDPPPVLHVQGCWPDWNERPWVAVVGARKASRWGLQKTREIVSALVEAGFGIVSGLAYGIDGEAHKTCVEKGGVTWGVLGSGIDRIYPLRHLTLAKKMEEKGGILSEFPLGTPPNGKHFPQRNRIISGLSQGVLIVEAAIKSGSLITARFALEQGREVFVVVPPEGEDVRVEGNRWLLEQGANVYESAGQVLEEIKQLGTAFKNNCPTRRTQNAERKTGNPILSFLNQPRSLDYLIQTTKKQAKELLSELTLLELQGAVKKIPGPLWQSL